MQSVLTRRASDAIVVVGMDPSLRNWGLSKATYYPITGELEVTVLDIVNPSVPDGKQVRNNSKDLACAQQLSQGAAAFCMGAKAVFVEVPHGSQSARAMASYGICLGVLGALRAQGVTFFEVSEAEVKLATIGKNKKVTKIEMIEWAMKQHPNAPWPMKVEKGVQSVVEGKAEHMADATGAIHAGIASVPFQQLLTLLKAATT